MKVAIVLLISSIRMFAVSFGAMRVTNSVTRDDLLQATVNGNSEKLETRELEVSVRYPDGKEAPKTVIVLFQPRTLLYLWVLVGAPREAGHPDQLEYKAASSAVGVGNGTIVWFMVGGPWLALVESTHRASSLDEACQRSLRDATLQLSVLQTDEPRQFAYVEIGKQLAEIGSESKADFFAPDLRSNLGPFPMIVQANYSESKWEVTIEANLKAKVLLGFNYKLLSIIKIPGSRYSAAPISKSPFQ